MNGLAISAVKIFLWLAILKVAEARKLPTKLFTTEFLNLLSLL
jgi:hypothetical protein